MKQGKIRLRYSWTIRIQKPVIWARAIAVYSIVSRACSRGRSRDKPEDSCRQKVSHCGGSEHLRGWLCNIMT